MRKRPVCNLWQQLVYLLRWPFCSGPICKTFSVCFKYETKIFCQSISLNRFLQTELSASWMAVCSQELLGIILLTDQFLETLPVYLQDLRSLPREEVYHPQTKVAIYFAESSSTVIIFFNGPNPDHCLALLVTNVVET